MKALTLILSLFLAIAIYSAPEEEKVTSLPEYSYEGPLYSGYLIISEKKKLHYMFNIALEDAENKPLILWLNGGPGCSSLDGWANEHGPMLLDDKGKFQLNNYTWVKEANIIYLESPADTGFSYINSSDKDDLYLDDNITAADNLQAILKFYEKFPEFKNQNFYISGESYGGIYVPILAYEVLEYNKKVEDSEKIKLKGILVGNGVADWNYDYTVAMMDFLFTHHLISYEDRLSYVKYCLTNETFNQTKCNEIINNTFEVTDGINYYDYLRDCEIPVNLKGELSTKSKYYKYARWAFKSFKTTDEDMTYLKDEEEGTPCFDDTDIEDYFNRQDVQAALHVKAERKWVVCSNDVYDNYNNTYTIGSVWAYPLLIKAGLRILIYSGDSDGVVSTSGNLLWIRDLNLETEEPWRQWRVDNDMDNVAGYVVKYKGLTFCTIRGVGHMAPGWKPKESYYMFRKFLKEEDL